MGETKENYEYKKNWFSPKYILIYLVIAGVVYGLIYYFFFGKKYGPGAVPAPATSSVVTWKINLQAQNGSKLDGTALLTEENGKTKVVLAFSGPEVTVQMPAHIHVGACPKPGAVKYPLTSVANGRSETVLPVTITELKSQLPLAINVHKSVVEVGVYVSCGDLK